MNNVIYLFALLGFGFVFAVIAVFFIDFKNWLEDKIAMAKYNHKKKHRFDKPPTAKCYCKDCYCYEIDKEYCSRFSCYGVSDCDFCCWAEPRKRDPEIIKQ